MSGRVVARASRHHGSTTSFYFLGDTADAVGHSLRGGGALHRAPTDNAVAATAAAVGGVWAVAPSLGHLGRLLEYLLGVHQT